MQLAITRNPKDTIQEPVKTSVKDSFSANPKLESQNSDKNLNLESNNLKDRINVLGETLAQFRNKEDINHQTEQEEVAEANDDENPWKISKEFLNIVREKYPIVLNWATVALHSAASSLPFMPFVSKEFANKVKQCAIVFSRYIVPINMIHNAAEDIFEGKRLFHGIARAIPPFCLPLLPFFNFSLPYGIYAGINFPTEEIVKRVGELSKNNTIAENNKKILDGLKAMWKDLGDQAIPFIKRFKLGSVFFASASMLIGAFGGLIFSPNSLNNLPATVFGFIRSMGGLIGDLNLILGKNSTKKEKAIGGLYVIGSLMDMTQRWITNPTINELYNHTKTSLNTIATMMWTHRSTERNREQEKKEKQLLHIKPKLQAA